MHKVAVLTDFPKLQFIDNTFVEWLKMSSKPRPRPTKFARQYINSVKIQITSHILIVKGLNTVLFNKQLLNIHLYICHQSQDQLNLLGKLASTGLASTGLVSPPRDG